MVAIISAAYVAQWSTIEARLSSNARYTLTPNGYVTLELGCSKNRPKEAIYVGRGQIVKLTTRCSFQSCEELSLLAYKLIKRAQIRSRAG